jgi:prepilin-type N-terminal cleavage/methylation domain-containing protein
MEPIHLRRGFIQPLNVSAGFTLIELLVVLAIMITITAIVLSSQSSFNKTLILANTAYDIGLTMRSAESFGLGSRALGGTANAGYGVHFQSGTLGSFILFADTSPAPSCTTPDCKPGDLVYSSGSDTLVQTYTFGNGITISNFCAYSVGGGLCKNQSGSYSGGLSSLDIVFARPNPDTSITANGSSYTGACVAITSPQSSPGVSRYVSISVSGEISANATSCP